MCEYFFFVKMHLAVPLEQGDVEDVGFYDILEKVASVGELGHQAQILVGYFADGIHAAQVCETHRDTQGGRGGSPAAGADQDGVAVPKQTVQGADLVGYGIFLVLIQLQVRFNFYKNDIVDRKTDISPIKFPFEEK